jgi:uncharacterized integral membrane protein
VRVVRRVLVLAVFVALLIACWRFAALNGQSVSVNYLFGELAEVAVWMVILGAFVAGGVVVGVICLLEMARLGLVARRYRKQAAGLESELHQLRNLPLAAEGPSLGQESDEGRED